MVSTTAGGSPRRISASHPGTTREDSTGLDAGARGCPLSDKGDPSSEEFAKEGLSWGASVLGTKSDWANIAPLRGPAPHHPWPTQGLCKKAHWGETHTYVGPEASWGPAEGPFGLRVKQLAVGRVQGGKHVYLSVPEVSPNQLDCLGVEFPFSQKGGADVKARRLHDWARLGHERRVATSDASDSKGGDGGRVVTCDRSVDCLDGSCTQQSQCCPYGPARGCCIAAIWSDAEQAIEQLKVVDMPLQSGPCTYAPGASETVSVEPPSCAGKSPGNSASTEHVLLRDVLWGWWVQLHTEKRDSLHKGEFVFSQLTQSPNWLRCLSTVYLCSHNCPRDWASMSQSSR